MMAFNIPEMPAFGEGGFDPTSARVELERQLFQSGARMSPEEVKALGAQIERLRVIEQFLGSEQQPMSWSQAGGHYLRGGDPFTDANSYSLTGTPAPEPPFRPGGGAFFGDTRPVNMPLSFEDALNSHLNRLQELHEFERITDVELNDHFKLVDDVRAGRLNPAALNDAMGDIARRAEQMGAEFNAPAPEPPFRPTSFRPGGQMDPARIKGALFEDAFQWDSSIQNPTKDRISRKATAQAQWFKGARDQGMTLGRPRAVNLPPATMEKLARLETQLERLMDQGLDDRLVYEHPAGQRFGQLLDDAYSGRATPDDVAAALDDLRRLSPNAPRALNPGAPGSMPATPATPASLRDQLATRYSPTDPAARATPNAPVLPQTATGAAGGGALPPGRPPFIDAESWEMPEPRYRGTDLPGSSRGTPGALGSGPDPFPQSSPRGPFAQGPASSGASIADVAAGMADDGAQTARGARLGSLKSVSGDLPANATRREKLAARFSPGPSSGQPGMVGKALSSAGTRAGLSEKAVTGLRSISPSVAYKTGLGATGAQFIAPIAGGIAGSWVDDRNIGGANSLADQFLTGAGAGGVTAGIASKANPYATGAGILIGGVGNVAYNAIANALGRDNTPADQQTDADRQLAALGQMGAYLSPESRRYLATQLSLAQTLVGGQYKAGSKEYNDALYQQRAGILNSLPQTILAERQAETARQSQLRDQIAMQEQVSRIMAPAMAGAQQYGDLSAGLYNDLASRAMSPEIAAAYRGGAQSAKANAELLSRSYLAGGSTLPQQYAMANAPTTRYSTTYNPDEGETTNRYTTSGKVNSLDDLIR